MHAVKEAEAVFLSVFKIVFPATLQPVQLQLVYLPG